MEKKIEVLIEISSINGWSVNWENSEEKKEQLERLSIEIKEALADNVGIGWNNIKVVKCEVVS